MLQKIQHPSTLETKLASNSQFSTPALAEMLNIEVETLNLINKCWKNGYVFIKDSHGSWSSLKDEYKDSDWFLDYSPVYISL